VACSRSRPTWPISVGRSSSSARRSVCSQASVVVLSAVGLFGLTSYRVTKRMRAMALRIALGPLPANVLWVLFGRVLVQVMLGLTRRSHGFVMSDGRQADRAE